MDNYYINSDLIRGNIDTIILRALVESDKYGYEILKEVETKSQGEYILKQPTLYSCLKRLESQGYITSFWGQITLGGRRKYYKITPKGKEYFEKIQADWEYSRTLIDKLIAKRRSEAINSEVLNNEISSINRELENQNHQQQNIFDVPKETDNVATIIAQDQVKTSKNNIETNSEQTIQKNTLDTNKLEVNTQEKESNKNNLESNNYSTIDQNDQPKKKEQIFIFGSIDDNKEEKDTEKTSIESSEKDVPIYVPLKGSPIYAKSTRALSDSQINFKEPVTDSVRSFINKDNAINHLDYSKTKNDITKNDQPALRESFIQENKFELTPLDEEKIKIKVDDELIGKTKINFNTDEVFFADQKKILNSAPMKSYGDLLMQETMEYFKKSISKKPAKNTQSVQSSEDQLYSMPNNASYDFNENILPSLGRTYESLEEAQQEYKLDKEYKNVLGKLFEEKNHVYEIKKADHNITRNSASSSIDQNTYSSFDLNNIKVVPFSKEVANEYYKTYYVYYNKFKLAQFLIFSLLLFVVNISMFLILNLGLKLDINSGYYFVGGLSAILIALMSSLAFFYKPNRRKKIYFDFKKEILNKFYLFLLLSALIVLILYIADRSLFLNFIHFSKALIGIILAFNVLSLPIIAKIMFKARAFCVKA